MLLEFSVDDNDSVREMAYQTFLKSDNLDWSFPMCQLPEKIVSKILEADGREKTRELLLQFANDIHQEQDDRDQVNSQVIKAEFLYFNLIGLKLLVQ